MVVRLLLSSTAHAPPAEHVCFHYLVDAKDIDQGMAGEDLDLHMTMSRRSKI